MYYRQTVKLKNTDFKTVIAAFHDINFVKFLTSLQPVKIIKWTGIKDGDIAYFKIWFFGWKNLFVTHKEYKKTDSSLSFIDFAENSFPFGIITWNHTHEVRLENESVLIIDNVTFTHGNKFLGILVYPILIIPIIVRKFLYRLYFYRKLFY